jgi:uncharacterized membrane protein
VSASVQMFRVGRRIALLSAALVCACAFVAGLLAVDANAAGTVAARPSQASAVPHLKMPASGLAPAQAKRSASAQGLFDSAVNFRNSYGKTVWVAIMRYNPDSCGGYGDWQTKGWWRLEPGEVKQAFTTSTRYAAFYAKAADGAEWTGDRGPVYVYHDAFDSCINIGSTAAYGTVGMRLIDLNAGHTINLIP